MLRNRLAKALPQSLNLNAGRTQTGDLNDRTISYLQQSAFGQFAQIQLPRRDVFAEVTRAHIKSLGIELVEQLGLYKMNLTEIWTSRIPFHVPNVLHHVPAVSIALDSQTLQQCDGFPFMLAEGVPTACEDPKNSCVPGFWAISHRRAPSFPVHKDRAYLPFCVGHLNSRRMHPRLPSRKMRPWSEPSDGSTRRAPHSFASDARPAPDPQRAPDPPNMF